MEVRFYESVADEQLRFAVIMAKAQGKWVFCKHKERDTYEVPGGHREPGESIWECACRELYEEMGAVNYCMEPISVYSVVDGQVEDWTYPHIQPILFEKVKVLKNY